MNNGGNASAQSGTSNDQSANISASADHLLTTPVPEPFSKCSDCDNTGYTDHAGFALDPCSRDHTRIAPKAFVERLEKTIIEVLASRSHGPVTAGEIAGAIRRSCLDIQPAPEEQIITEERSDCRHCNGFGYFIMAPSTCSSGGERVKCGNCNPGMLLSTPPAQAEASTLPGEVVALSSAVGYAAAILLAHADKFPIPEHAKQLASRCREASNYLAATPPTTPAVESGEEFVEALAQFLHDEGGFDEAFNDRTWPEHPDDTGQREGGWVKIVPSDAQAKFRDVARRLATMYPRPALRASEQDVAKAAERIFDFANDYLLQPKPKSEQDFADPENYWHRAALAAIGDRILSDAEQWRAQL